MVQNSNSAATKHWALIPSALFPTPLATPFGYFMWVESHSSCPLSLAYFTSHAVLEVHHVAAWDRTESLHPLRDALCDILPSHCLHQTLSVFNVRLPALLTVPRVCGCSSPPAVKHCDCLSGTLPSIQRPAPRAQHPAGNMEGTSWTVTCESRKSYVLLTTTSQGLMPDTQTTKRTYFLKKTTNSVFLRTDWEWKDRKSDVTLQEHL